MNKQPRDYVIDKNMQRKRECLSCGHEWTSNVVYSVYTQNLSGEARVWCPECSSASIMSHQREQVENEEVGGRASPVVLDE